MKPTFSFLLLSLTLLVYPPGSFAFNYSTCVNSGDGTNVQAIGASAFRKAFSVASRQIMRAKIDDDVKAREVLQRDIDREQRMQEREERANQQKRYESGSSASEVKEQLRRSKQETQTPVTVGPSAPFVLLSEVKEPLAKRQPEISFGTHRDSAQRSVRLFANGLMAPREVHIVCDQETRSIPLITTSTNDGRTVATYEVSRATLLVALASGRRELVLGGARLSIPQDKLFSAWGRFCAT